jgi:hypothetical protein
MIRRKLVGLGMVLLVSPSAASPQAAALVAPALLNPDHQNLERTIVTKDDRRSPVKILRVRTKGREVESNKTFAEGDDWLKDLAVEVTNTSDKTVTFIQIELFFPRAEPETEKPGAIFNLDFGDNPFRFESAADMPPLSVKPVLPGGHQEIALSEAKLSAVNALLTDTGFLVKSKVEVKVNLVGFSDGTAWSGQMVQRQSKGGWVPM